VDTATPRIAVQPGDGLVGRYGDTALLVSGHDPDEAQFVEELVAAVEAAGAEGPLPGGTLAHRLGELVLGAGSGRVASFGVVAPVETGTLVFLHGDVGVTVDGASGSQHLSGTEAVTWVDRLLTEPFDRLSLSLVDAEPAPAHPRSDLRVGVVPGAGLVWLPGSGGGRAPEEGPTPPAREVPEWDTESVPAPAARQTAGSALFDAEAEEEGTVAPPHPGGATMAARTAPGELVDEDGSRTPLDRDYVLGREPGGDEEVRTGKAAPLVIDDPDQLVSRVHARLRSDGGVAFIEDAPSANGTFIAAPDSTSWTRVGPEATELPPGWKVRLGNQVYTFETSTGSDG
jgi:hypothetical protein